MGPGGVSGPGTRTVSPPMTPLLLVLCVPCVVSTAGSFLFPWQPLFVVSTPLTLVYTLVFALSVCYSLQSRAGKMQPGVYFPAISQLGIESPEKTFYQVGMALVALCMAVGMTHLEAALGPHYLFGKNATARAVETEAFRDCRRFGFIAAAGVCTQGLFTLELKLSARSFLHWGGTAVFAYGAFNHCNLFMRLLDGVESPLAEEGWVQLSKTAKHLFLERVPSLLFFLPILGQVVGAAGIGAGAGEDAKKKEEKQKQKKEEEKEAARERDAKKKKDDDAPAGNDNEKDDNGNVDANAVLANMNGKTLTEAVAKLTDSKKARIVKYQDELKEWKRSKLAQYDSDPDFRQKRDIKSGSIGGDATDRRDSYEHVLDQLATKRLAQAVVKLISEANNDPDSAEAQPMTPAVANSMGLMQWMMIGMFVVFFATYSVDLYYATKIVV